MLPDCLDSVAGQTHPDVEHILVDGASTDGTLALLQARRAVLAQLVSEPDGGIYFGLNKGIALAGGEVLGFLHGDDVDADAQVLARVAEVFADPAVQAVYGDLESVSQADSTRVVRHWRAGAYQPRRLRWGPAARRKSAAASDAVPAPLALRALRGVRDRLSHRGGL